MKRDEFLATRVMLWVADVRYNQTKYIESLPCGGVRYRDADCWHPGEDWSQAGMILEVMAQSFQMNVFQFVDSGEGYNVIFKARDSDVYGQAEESDLREVIATAAARVKGWEG